MHKRSSALLLLIELVAMLLVFALCTAIALRMFTEARSMAQASRRLGIAVDVAQEVAEIYRLNGDAERAASALSAVWHNDRYQAEYTCDTEQFTVYLYPLEKQLRILVFVADTSIYEILVGAI